MNERLFEEGVDTKDKLIVVYLLLIRSCGGGAIEKRDVSDI